MINHNDCDDYDFLECKEKEITDVLGPHEQGNVPYGVKQNGDNKLKHVKMSVFFRIFKEKHNKIGDHVK